jgi:hypothetical protein
MWSTWVWRRRVRARRACQRTRGEAAGGTRCQGAAAGAAAGVEVDGNDGGAEWRGGGGEEAVRGGGLLDLRGRGSGGGGGEEPGRPCAMPWASEIELQAWEAGVRSGGPGWAWRRCITEVMTDCASRR